MGFPEQSLDPALTGTTIERYRIEALIGRGGMGEVYRAVDERLRRKVALKVLRPRRDPRPDDSDGVARLFREARAAAALSHPNVVVIHDLGEVQAPERLFFIVMELVAGQPLLAYVGDDGVSVARKLRWLVQIASALASAHKAGVLHRDVKPSNVMVTEDDTAKVLDFGLAKSLAKSVSASEDGEPPSSEFRTQAGRVLGTFRYMAPEQLAGELDARCDQFSFGVTAYELFAGSFLRDARGEPPPLDVVLPGFPKPAARVVGRMIALDPNKRFESMDDVVTALEDVAAGRPLRLSMSEPPSTASADTVRDPGAPRSAGSGRPTEPDVAAKAAGPPEATATLLSREAPSELRNLDAALLKRKEAPAVESAEPQRALPRPGLLEGTLLSAGKVVPVAAAAGAAPKPASPPRARAAKSRTPVALIWLLVVLVAAAIGITLGARSSRAPSAPEAPAPSAS